MGQIYNNPYFNNPYGSSPTGMAQWGTQLEQEVLSNMLNPTMGTDTTQLSSQAQNLIYQQQNNPVSQILNNPTVKKLQNQLQTISQDAQSNQAKLKSDQSQVGNLVQEENTDQTQIFVKSDGFIQRIRLFAQSFYLN